MDSVTKVAPTIQTFKGIAYFVTTERENEFGMWDDSWAIRDGFFVIHDGRFHHVYRV